MKITGLSAEINQEGDQVRITFDIPVKSFLNLVKQLKEVKKEKTVTVSVPVQTDIEGLTLEQNNRWDAFQSYLQKECPQVLKMKEPFVPDQFVKLVDKHGAKAVADICAQMHNRANLLRDYRSAYLTANNWLNRGNNTENRDGEKTLRDQSDAEVRKRIGA